MECKCCGESVENDLAKCSVCGFPLLGDLGDKLPQILSDYRNTLLHDVSLAVKLYYYGYDDDGEMGELKSGYVKVADAPATTFFGWTSSLSRPVSNEPSLWMYAFKMTRHHGIPL